MPYRGPTGFEHANPLGHVPTLQHPIVRERLALYRMPQTRVGDTDAIRSCLLDPSTLTQIATPARWVMATDSSPFEPEIDPEFPSTRMLFVQVAAVICDLERMRLRSGGFVDPAAIRDAQRASVVAGMLPSSNLIRADGTLPRVAFREEVDHLFRSTEIEGSSLLQVMLDVAAERDDSPVPAGASSISRCPNLDCRADIETIPVGPAGADCPSCGERLLPTDALRAHEIFREHGSNQEACSRVLSVAERLASLALLSHIQTRRASALAQVAFVTDGPLALFGEVAPLKWPLLRRLQRIAESLRAAGLESPVTVGLEKSGIFYEHAQAIRDHIPEGQMMVPDTSYMERYITFRGSPHGKDTYYGRHVFYRATGGQVYVMTVPPLARVGAQPHEPFASDDYPTLAATCALLERIGTRLYPDATIPVTLAHRYAAYPLETAGRVLKLHAEEHLDRAAKTVGRIDSVSGAIMAAPMPMSARAAMSASAEGLAAASADAAPKATRPHSNTRLRPIRSPSIPAGSSRAAKATT